MRWVDVSILLLETVTCKFMTQQKASVINFDSKNGNKRPLCISCDFLGFRNYLHYLLGKGIVPGYERRRLNSLLH